MSLQFLECKYMVPEEEGLTTGETKSQLVFQGTWAKHDWIKNKSKISYGIWEETTVHNTYDGITIHEGSWNRHVQIGCMRTYIDLYCGGRTSIFKIYKVLIVSDNELFDVQILVLDGSWWQPHDAFGLSNFKIYHFPKA